LRLAERPGRQPEALGQDRREREDGADRRSLVDDEPAAREDDERRTHGLQDPHEGPKAAPDHRRADLEPAQLVVGAAEARLLGALADERLDQQGAGDAQHLLEIRRELGELRCVALRAA
jgi:hypothetical protein